MQKISQTLIPLRSLRLERLVNPDNLFFGSALDEKLTTSDKQVKVKTRLRKQ